MKKALLLAACALVIGGLFAACGGGSEPVSVKSSVIRLHVLANSDSESDQQTKLQVRDMLLEKWGKQLAGMDTSAEAWDALNELLPEIKQDVDALLKDRNAGYSSAIDTGVYGFPEREYNGVAFPEGEYRAVRIELGSATGRNWWCVMFPPLCLIGEDGEMSIEEYKELVKELDEEAGAPSAPVRSWLFDTLFGEGQWDDDFLQWAKEYWTEGDD